MQKSLSYTNIHNGYNELLAFFCEQHKKVTPPHVEPILQGQTKGTDK